MNSSNSVKLAISKLSLRQKQVVEDLNNGGVLITDSDYSGAIVCFTKESDKKDYEIGNRLFCNLYRQNAIYQQSSPPFNYILHPDYVLDKEKYMKQIGMYSNSKPSTEEKSQTFQTTTVGQMEQTVTNEESKEKEQFFAQYWGLEVLVDTIGKKSSNTQILNKGTFPYSRDIQEYYLRLKPLSEITDEDALGVANIFKWNHYSDESKINQVKTYLSQYLDYHNSNISSIENMLLLDFLRSKGYAVQWKQYSVQNLIDKGWVELAKPQKTK